MTEEESKFIVEQLRAASGEQLSDVLMEVALLLESQSQQQLAAKPCFAVIAELHSAIEAKRWSGSEIAVAFFALGKCAGEPHAAQILRLAALLAPSVREEHLARQILIALENCAHQSIIFNRRHAEYLVGIIMQEVPNVWAQDLDLRDRVIKILNQDGMEK